MTTDRVHYSLDGRIGIIRLDDGKANAMQGELFDQLGKALDRAEADKVSALIITGREKFFSGGLDLKALPMLKKDELTKTLAAFPVLMQRVFLFPAPVICASNGHALAGGMVLYLMGDVRIAVDNDAHKYGLNETAIGLPLPSWVVATCAQTIPHRYHMDMMVHARVMPPKETHRREVTQELVASADDLMPKAMEKAKELSKLIPAAYIATKLRLRKPPVDIANARAAEEVSGFLSTGPFANLK
ncbi:MAG: enoyl-CoA hydratase/isomerase family protein [Deltaproteobacteria bacterium]|nr:enoyl-CoA hydratase/isomerase family protein [Deltaproteobacteria bacterium]